MFKTINKVIKVLILSDFFLLLAWGLISPILAIFIVENIKGGDAKVAGTAIGIYWLLKSLLQIPIGRYLDRTQGEKDDYYFLIFGTFLSSLTPLGYIFSSWPWHIYILQSIQALGMAMAIPAWGGIFMRHVDKGKEAVSWSLESSSLGIGAGIAGILGGIIAKNFGFKPVFLSVTILGIISSLLLFLIAKEILPKEKIFTFPKIF